jgi:hypothetical protein
MITEKSFINVYRLFSSGVVLLLLAGCNSVANQPVNVQGGAFLNQSCPKVQVIYTVPKGKLLIIEDASARAVNSATASIPGNPGIVDDVPVNLSLRTNPSGNVEMGSADHIIVHGVGLPVAGGRTMKAYAAPETEVFFLLGGCNVNVNTTVHFSGKLVDYP